LIEERYLDAVSAIVGARLRADTHLLSLEETDELFTKFSSAFSGYTSESPKCLRLRVPDADSAKLFGPLAELSTSASNIPVALFGRESEYTGALRLQSVDVFRNAYAFLQLETDELRVAAIDGPHGFLVDHMVRERELELWLWGDEWRGHLAMDK